MRSHLSTDTEVQEWVPMVTSQRLILRAALLQASTVHWYLNDMGEFQSRANDREQIIRSHTGPRLVKHHCLDNSDQSQGPCRARFR